jgi:hypothetical protein
MCRFSIMMRSSTVLLFMTTASVWAGFTVPAGPWQQLPNPLAVSGERIVDTNRNLAGNQTAYWNNNTADGTTCKNIGCIVTGRVASTATDPLTNAIWRDAAYIANADGTAVTNVYFKGSVSGPAVLNGEITSLKARSWVGWYDSTLSPAALTSANFGTRWGVIFKGSDTVGKQANFSSHQPVWLLVFGWLLEYRQDFHGALGSTEDQHGPLYPELQEHHWGWPDHAILHLLCRESGRRQRIDAYLVDFRRRHHSRRHGLQRHHLPGDVCTGTRPLRCTGPGCGRTRGGHSPPRCAITTNPPQVIWIHSRYSVTGTGRTHPVFSPGTWRR